MQTVSKILARIKEQIDMNDAEIMGYFVNASRKEQLERDNVLLRQIEKWIKKS